MIFASAKRKIFMRIGELATHKPNQFLGQMQHDPPGLHPDSKPELCLHFTSPWLLKDWREAHHCMAPHFLHLQLDSITQQQADAEVRAGRGVRIKEEKKDTPTRKRLELTWHLFLSSTHFPAAFLPALEEACDIGPGGGVQYREPPMSPNPTTAQTIMWAEITAMFFFFNKKKMTTKASF